MTAYSLWLALLFSPLAMAASESTTLTAKEEAATPPAAPKWSATYSYYRYQMEGTTTANTNIYKFGDASVDLTLFTLTYQASPKWTLLTFVPYVKNTVETIYEPVPGGFNMSLTDKVEGLGDVRFMAMNMAWVQDKNIGFYDVGFSVPTGATDRKFPSVTTGQGASYNMQPGSGTVDLTGGVTYIHLTTAKWNQTARMQYTARTGSTGKGYSLGDELQGSVATKYQALSFLNTALQFSYKNRGAVHGKDTRYERFNNWSHPGNPGIASGDGHQYYHGSQINYELSAIMKGEYKFKWAKATLEAGVPLWQDAVNLDNIRLDTRYYVSGSVGAAF